MPAEGEVAPAAEYAPMAKEEDAAGAPEGDAEEPEGREIDMPEDIYGATMFSIIFDFYDICTPGSDADELHTSMNIMRLCFIFCVLMVNYLLQCGMLFWIYAFVVLPSVHVVENVYQKYHAEIFTDGKYDTDKWEAWDMGNKEELCGIAFANYWFMFAILILWCYTMLIEVRKTERLGKDLKAVEDCTDLADMIDMSGDAPRFVKLTKGIDWLLYLVIIVPKFIISILLLLIGCVWLTATDSFGDLILNAVALEFVVNIDNLLYESAMPMTVCEKVAETKFFVAKSPESNKQKLDKTVGGYRRSMMYFFGVWVFVALLMSFGQNLPVAGVFPSYSHDAECPGFQAQISKRICQQGDNCFPFA